MGEEKNHKIKSELYLFGKGVVFVVSVITAIWFFGRAPFNEKVDERIKLYIESAAMQVYVDHVIEKYQEEQAEKNSKRVKLRTLLSIKMGVDEDEVHIELGRQFKNEKEIKKLIDKLIQEVETIKRKQNETN